MNTENGPSLEELIAHAEFVRALAGRLLRDDALADDVAQDAMLAGIERRERIGSGARGWLALVFVSEYWHEDSVTADRGGKFQIPLMPPGRSHLVAEVKGTMRAYVPVDIAPVVQLVPRQGTILATVRDREGHPVSDFPFNAMPMGADGRPDRNRRAIVGKDCRGILRLDAVPGGWTLEPHPNRKRALAVQCPSIEVTDGNTTRVELTLD